MKRHLTISIGASTLAIGIALIGFVMPALASMDGGSADGRASAANAFTCAGQTATITVLEGIIVGGPNDGQPYNGRLEGTSGPDVLVGTDGSDTILGGGGADIICGLAGDDQIDGQTGEDTIYGGPGSDTLLGGQAQDTLYGEEGSDVLRGGTASDLLVGGPGGDFLFGENGPDKLEGGPGNDVLNGGAGEDTIWGGTANAPNEDTGSDTIQAGPGSDTVFAGDGDNVIEGNNGDDTLIGGDDGDNIDGGMGEDLCNPKGGANIVQNCEQEVTNQAPQVVGTIPDQITPESASISFSVVDVFTDPDADPLTYGAANLPPGIEIVPETGLISGTVGVSAVEMGPIYEVTVGASDGIDQATTTFTWQVEQNEPSGFVLINAETDEDIVAIGANEVIDLSTLPTSIINIRIELPEPEIVESVELTLNGMSRLENEPPYSFAGDTNGDYIGYTPQVGTYTLKAVPFTGPYGSGEMLEPIEAVVTFTNTGAPPTVTGFTLLNPATDEAVGPLVDGAEISLSELGTDRISAEALVEGLVESVTFELDGLSRTENGAPYTAVGDTDGNFFGIALEPGTYTLSATAFTGDNATGDAGETLSITFTIVE